MSYTVVKKLLEEPEWDPEAFKRALRDHWGIPCMTEPEDGEDGESTLVFEVEGMLAALSLYPFPVPHGEAEENAAQFRQIGRSPLPYQASLFEET